jgi:hypothetical protein
MIVTQCDCMNTAMNWPASPVGIGPIGKNGCNPFAPKNANVNPNNTRATITTIFIPSPPSKFKDVRLDAQAEHYGAGIKSRSNHSLTAQTFGGRADAATRAEVTPPHGAPVFC